MELVLSGNDLIIINGSTDIVVSKERLYEILSCQESQNIYKDRIKEVTWDGHKSTITLGDKAASWTFVSEIAEDMKTMGVSQPHSDVCKCVEERGYRIGNCGQDGEHCLLNP